MYIRCSACRGTNRISPDPGPKTVCPDCGHGNDLSRLLELGATPAERAERTTQFAEQLDLDLASAYSVLLGIMSPEECKNPPARRARPPQSEEAAPTHYDPAFRDAIAAGHLTIRQAVERGDRCAFASKIAQKHSMTMNLAFRVADNEIQIAEAIERLKSPAPTSAAKSSSTWHLWLFKAAAVVVLMVCSWGIGRMQVTSPDSGVAATRDQPRANLIGDPDRPRESMVVVDPAGPTQINGSDPRTVLDAFCRVAPPDLRRTPLRVSPTDAGWVGFFREDGQTFSIDIAKNPGGDGWVTGNGKSLIAPKLAF